MGDCVLCPDHSTTLAIPATGLADCLCDEGWFLTTATDGSALCSACPQPGTNCSARGVTLAGLPLAPPYWRRGADRCTEDAGQEILGDRGRHGGLACLAPGGAEAPHPTVG